METIYSQENSIFEKYKTDSNLFVKDGFCFGNFIQEFSVDAYNKKVVSLYCNYRPRIVFVCKEPNRNGGEDYRYWDWVTRKSNCTFGDSIAFWLDGILKVTENGFSRKCDLNKEREILKTHPFVLMNIKKTAGGATSKWSTLYNSAKENAVLLQEQINLYSPDIIFCCGSTDKETDKRNRMITLVKEYLYPDYEFVRLKEEWHYCYYNKEKHLLLIDSYHPSYNVSDTWKFDNLFTEYHDFLSLEGESWFDDEKNV